MLGWGCASINATLLQRRDRPRPSPAENVACIVAAPQRFRRSSGHCLAAPIGQSSTITHDDAETIRRDQNRWSRSRSGWRQVANVWIDTAQVSLQFDMIVATLKISYNSGLQH